MSEDKNRQQLILDCRYFNDEDKAPDWMSQNERMFWFYEKCWINFILEGKKMDYLTEYPSMRDFMLGDGTPQDLKALICDRFCHFGGTVEGFTRLYMDEYHVRLTNRQRKDNEWRLRRCRLYDGKGQNEYEHFRNSYPSFREPVDGYKEDKTDEEIKEILSIFYFAEYTWIVINTPRITYSRSGFESVFGEDKDFLDGTPRDLQAMLFLCFLQSIDGVYHRFETQYEFDLFKRYYMEYYQPILSPIQRREKERRPMLLGKCCYYKGERTNPWEFCYSPVLDWRRRMWEIEREWVNAMMDSYNCPQSSKQLIKDLALVEFFRSKGISLSLLNLVLLSEKDILDENKERFGAIEAIKIYEKYRKLTPLGRDHRMYFAFYLGEEDFPCGYDDDDEYKRMGWTQERLQEHHYHEGMCDYNSEEFQEKYRGKEGVWGWYADPRYPKQQKDILFFNICNWGTWCPYCDEDKLAEQYLNFHYPGSEK